MNKASYLLVALCMMGFSACSTQQKGNEGPLPVADFTKEYPAKDC